MASGLTNPPKRGLRGLGQTAAIDSRLRADKGPEQPRRQVSLKSVRREIAKDRSAPDRGKA